MTPGSIDLKVIANRLDLVERCLTELRALPAETPEMFLADRRNPPAAESLLRRAIEGLLDTARHLLAKGFGLGALEYRQVAQLALEKGLIQDPELGRRFAQIAGFRNRLTHHYEEVTNQELYQILTTRLDDLGQIRQELRQAATRTFHL